MAIGNVESVANNPFVSQIVTTTNGDKLIIPTMLGSSTKIKPLDNGKYEVTTKGSKMNAEPVVKIMSEEQLVARYGQNTGKNLQAIG